MRSSGISISSQDLSFFRISASRIRLSFLHTSDGSLRKKPTLPPEIHSVLQVLEFVFLVFLFVFSLPAAVEQYSGLLPDFYSHFLYLFLLFLPCLPSLQVYSSVYQALPLLSSLLFPLQQCRRIEITTLV